MEHNVNMRIVLNASVRVKGKKTDEDAKEFAEQEIDKLLTALDGRNMDQWSGPYVKSQEFIVAEIETTDTCEV